MNELNELSKEDLQFVNEKTREIGHILNCGGMIFMSWSVKKMQILLHRGMAALKFEVYGLSFNGYVIVAYNERTELYEAYFQNWEYKTVKVLKNIYLDELVEVLDNVIFSIK